jgi:virulence-associated protein VapD
MAQCAIAFDLDTAGMRAAGLTQAQITAVYQREIPDALKECGFAVHPRGALYHTDAEQDPVAAIMRLRGGLLLKRLQGGLVQNAPNFCRFVKRVHVFRIEEPSDVTALIADLPAAGPPGAEEELEEQEADGSSHAGLGSPP